MNNSTENVIKIKDLSSLPDSREKITGSSPDKARMTPATFESFKYNVLDPNKIKSLEERYQKVYIKLKDTLEKLDAERISKEKNIDPKNLEAYRKNEEKKNELNKVIDKMKEINIAFFSLLEKERIISKLYRDLNLSLKALKVPKIVVDRIRTIRDNYEEFMVNSVDEEKDASNVVEAVGNWQTVFLNNSVVKVQDAPLKPEIAQEQDQELVKPSITQKLLRGLPKKDYRLSKKARLFEKERFEEMKNIAELGAALDSLRSLSASDNFDSDLKDMLQKYIHECTKQLSDILEIDLTINNDVNEKTEEHKETEIQKFINETTGVREEELTEEEFAEKQEEYDQLFNSDEGIQRMQSLMRKEYLEFWNRPEVYGKVLETERKLDDEQARLILQREEEEIKRRMKEQEEEEKRLEELRILEAQEEQRKLEEEKIRAEERRLEEERKTKVSIVDLAEIIKEDENREKELKEARKIYEKKDETPIENTASQENNSVNDGPLESEEYYRNFISNNSEIARIDTEEIVQQPVQEVAPQMVAPEIVQQPVQEVAPQMVASEMVQNNNVVMTPSRMNTFIGQKLAPIGASITELPSNRYAIELGRKPLKISSRQFEKISSLPSVVYAQENPQLLQNLKEIRSDLRSLAPANEELPTFMRKVS